MKRRWSKTPGTSEEEEEGSKRKSKAIRGMSSSTPVGSTDRDYNVVLCFDDVQDHVKDLSKRLREVMENFGICIFDPDKDVLEVSVTGKAFVPVFSRGFASNTSCLEMLVTMVACRSYSATNHILPIFFGYEPSDGGRLGDKVVADRWKEALIEVSNMEGRFIPETVGLGGIYYHINKVCQLVLRKLKLSQLSMGNHLVGMDHHVKRILNLLNLEVNDVEVIAISGEDGAGKTTLARALYHELSSSFEASSFLADIDKRACNSSGIRFLQAKLVSDLLNKKCKVLQTVDEGENLIREKFCHKKVLVVLDDIHWNSDVMALAGQLNWFGPGSRIIITTTRSNLISLVHSVYDISCHGMLSAPAEDKAIQLFCRHAFRNDNPLLDFHRLAADIVHLLSPSNDRLSLLAIGMVGSLLYGKSKSEWESMLLDLAAKRKNRFIMFFFSIIKMSYESLNEKQKEIFLDISCFPNGMDRQMALLLWHNSLHSSLDDFEVLIGLSLVKVDANNRIWMHCFIRAFGRGIIRIQQLLRKDRKDLAFWDISNMRYFKLEHEETSGRDDRYFMEQRNIICRSRFLPLLKGDHHVEHLKILDLSWSKIREDWDAWHQIHVPQLRVLNLTGCDDLMVTPDFTFCPDLEMLILEHCSRLVKIHPSIRILQRLAIFNLRYCTELSVLPKEVGCLKVLKEILVDGTSIKEIPGPIGHMKKLQALSAVNCSSLSHLPNSTCNLLSITVLKLDGANVSELPYSIWKRMKLQYLSLRDCKCIESLPPFAGEVEIALVELDVSGTSISELPESIINLKYLRVLKMDFCFIMEFPPGFGQMKKLEEVHASSCRRLENLPHDIGGLESLRILKVGHSCISNLPQSIQSLVHLKVLDCTSCNMLQSLPNFPSSLTSLHVQSKKLKTLPDLYDLENLEEFTLVNDSNIGNSVSQAGSVSSERDPLYWLTESSSLRTLKLCLPYTRDLPGFPHSLRKLSLQCEHLLQIPPFPSTLAVLSIKNSRLLKELPSVESLQNLLEMEVVCCPEIKKIEGLERLQALQALSISDCGIESLNGLSLLKSLRRLTLQDCRSLRILHSVGFLNNLLEIKIIGCLGIKRIVGLERLQALQVLSISNCGIESLDGLDKLNSLTKLIISDCRSLSQVPDLSKLESLKERCVLLQSLGSP